MAFQAAAAALLFVAFFIPGAQAQSPERRFRAAVVAGFTASQIDGDYLAGYDKLGIQAGLQVSTPLKKKMDVSLGLLFTQRGSQNELVPSGDDPLFRLTLNYVEVPVQWHYKDWRTEYEAGVEYYRVWFNAGLSYGRLIGYKLKDDLNAVSTILDKLNDNDIGATVGITYWLNPKFGLSFRYNRSFVYIWDPRKFNSPDLRFGWNGHFLSFLAQYSF